MIKIHRQPTQQPLFTISLRHVGSRGPPGTGGSEVRREAVWAGMAAPLPSTTLPQSWGTAQAITAPPQPRVPFSFLFACSVSTHPPNTAWMNG